MTIAHALQAVSDCYPDLSLDFITNNLRYSSFVSLPKRYMYFQVPKAACTFMKGLLNQIENAPPIRHFIGEDRETRRDMFIHVRENVPLPSLLDLDNQTQRQVLESPDFLRMTVVRNPYTRLLSAWKNKVLLCEPGFESVYLDIKGRLPEEGRKVLVTFEEFVEYVSKKCDLRTCNAHWRRQVDHTFMRALNFSFVGKMENLAETLERLQRHLGLGASLSEGGKNVSGSLGEVTFHEELRERIYRLYQEDFETLQYDRSLPPCQPQGTNHAVPEEKYINEIIERNIIINHLYEQRAELRKLSHLHLHSIANGWLASLDTLGKLLEKRKGRTRT